MGERAEIGDGVGDSAWAGDVPVPAAPAEFSWATDERARSASDQESVNSDKVSEKPQLVVSAPTGGETLPGSDLPGAPGPRRPSTPMIVVAGLAALAAVVGLLTIVRDDQVNDLDDAAPAPTSEVAEQVAPTPSTDLPAVEEPVVERPVIEEPVVGSAERPETAGGAANGSLLVPGEWQNETMSLPVGLRQFAELTTLVALGADGVFREIDLPSGEVRSIKLDRARGLNHFVAGQTSTLLVDTSGDSVLLRAGEEPIELTLDGELFAVHAPPVSDEYVASLYNDDQIGAQQLRILPDGSTLMSGETESRDVPASGLYAPNGDELIHDAGGVYRVGDDGEATRISEGVVVASSDNHLLFRECDVEHECVYVRTNGLTVERTVVAIADDVTSASFLRSARISPNGGFVRYPFLNDEGVAEKIVDLNTGDSTIVAQTALAARAEWSWEGGGSGLFGLGDSAGLKFVDRVTGEVTVFGEEFGPIDALAVRYESVAPAVLVPPRSGLRIVGLDRDGSIHHIEIDSGEFTTVDGPPLGSSAPGYLYPDADGVTVTSYDFVRTIRLDYGGDAPKLLNRLEPTGAAIAGPLPGTIWQQREDSLFDLLDAYGQSLGPTIDIPQGFESAPIGSDGRGGVLLLSSLGGVYTASPEGVERITTGEMLAAGSTAAYVRECDDQFQCGVVRVDWATGARGLLKTSEFDTAGSDYSMGGVAGSSVSPDGEVALVLLGGLGTTWTMIDTAAETAVAVPSVASGSAFAWSADSQYGLYLSGDILQLYDRATNSVRTLGAYPKLRSFAVIPLDVASIPAPVAIDASAPPEGTTEALVVGPSRFPF